MLHRIAKAVEGADARIAAPGENELSGAAGADDLVIDQIGRHAHQGKIAPALADDLMAGREGNQVREALQCEEVTVLYESRDCFRKRRPLSHYESSRISRK
jgi:hypothetical protein